MNETRAQIVVEKIHLTANVKNYWFTKRPGGRKLQKWFSKQSKAKQNIILVKLSSADAIVP